MKILALDIGTGTQDILLFDSSTTIENCLKMVMPSPTAIAAKRISQATKERRAIALTGPNMGGGPSTGAAATHIQSGLPVYATVEAATTFNDDMNEVKAMGITLVSEDEIKKLKNTIDIELKDLDIEMVSTALESFGVETQWDALAVAVFDHGDSPSGYSDRRFRFDHLRNQVYSGSRNIRSSCYLEEDLPEYMTRMVAVSRSNDLNIPTLFMNTAEAAVLGSLEDKHVASQNTKVVANLGNEHTLAFYLDGETIQGLFEHHTHLLQKDKLEKYIDSLVKGDLDNETIWNDHGHGSIVLDGGPQDYFLSVTGPMRYMLEGSRLNPYFATPHGDMMLAGSFGLIRAWAEKNLSWREEILNSLR